MRRGGRLTLRFSYADAALRLRRRRVKGKADAALQLRCAALRRVKGKADAALQLRCASATPTLGKMGWTVR